MGWRVLSFHYKQTYEGGYRYLDRCGEFMVLASQKYGFVPGDAKPSGAKLEQPERGIKVGVDTVALTVTQEINESTMDFLHACKALTDLAIDLFQPLQIQKNGLACKFFWGFNSSAEMLETTIKVLASEADKKLVNLIGMAPEQHSLDRWYRSGSKEFHLTVEPVTFERPTFQPQNAGFRASPGEKSIIDKRNTFGQLLKEPLYHAIVLGLDLMENDPPAKHSLDEQFAELMKVSDNLKTLFSLK
jgi:hypothetical protein